MSSNNNQLDAIRGELEALKRLAIYALIQNGHSQAQIAEALGVNQSTISRMFKIQNNDKKEV